MNKAANFKVDLIIVKFVWEREGNLKDYLIKKPKIKSILIPC